MSREPNTPLTDQATHHTCADSLANRVRKYIWLASSVLAMQIAGHPVRAHADELNDPNKEAPALDPGASADDIFGALFGGKQQAAAILPYPVVISGLNRGDVTMTPGSTPEETFIERKAVVDLLLPFLVEEKQAELLQTLPTRGQISAADLNRLGFDAHFNHFNLFLEINIPLEMRSIVPLPVRPSFAGTNLDTVEQARTSAIVNAIAGTQYIHSSEFGQTGFAATQANVDVALNVRGLVLETGLRYSETTDSGAVLNDTRITKDFVDRRVRLEAGDLTVPTTGLQGNPDLLGLAGFRNFGLQPYKEYRTNPSQRFELQRSARISVYINGQFVRDFRLQAGRYSLTDLPLQSAAGNDVVLEIEYDSGDTERIVFSAFYDFSLLKSGETDFGVSVGPTSDLVDGQREYDFDNPAISGFYNKGWSDRLTAGVNFQADTEIANVGGEAFYSTGIGTFGMLASFSDMDAGSGAAITGLYRWNDTDLKHKNRFDVQFRYQDEQFMTLGGANPLYKYDLSARASRSLTDTVRMQLGSRFTQRHGSSDFEQSHSANLTWNTRYGALGTSFRYQDSRTTEGWSVGISFNMRLGDGNAQFFHDTRTPSTRIGYNSRIDRSVGSFGWDTTYTHQSNSDELRAGASYIGNRFEARAEQIVAPGRTDRNFGAENTTEFSLGSALVYADGNMALSRPVYDSFAIVTKSKAVKGFDIAVDPQGSLFDTHPSYASYSSPLGPAVVPDLNSYYLRTVEVEAPDAPAGTSLGGQVFNFIPGYRSGHVVEVGDSRNVAVMSVLVDQNGEPIPFAAGYAITSDGERQQMFTNRGGRFYIDGLKHGETVKMEFDSPEGATGTFVVPEGEIGVMRLPNPIRIQTQEEQSPYNVTMRIHNYQGG